jgi:hypothetical protein
MVEKRRLTHRERRTPDHVRDSSLIVIATEGKKTEKVYFEYLSSRFKNSRVNVRVLTNVDNHSSPEQVMGVMDNFLKEIQLEENDQCWLVIDRDRWETETLSRVASLCSQKNISLAISNPSFEFWLLLHVKNLDEYSNEEKDLILLNRKVSTTRTWLERELVNILGSYNKSSPNCDHFFPGIDKAIHQAESLDINPEHRWPNGLGSRVFRLVQIILSYNSSS